MAAIAAIMVAILAAIFKMAAKMRKISKCTNFNEN